MIDVKERKKQYRWKSQLVQLKAQSKSLYKQMSGISQKTLDGHSLTYNEVVEMKSNYEKWEKDLCAVNRKIEYRQTMLGENHG